jgi:hypothetical protein
LDWDYKELFTNLIPSKSVDHCEYSTNGTISTIVWWSSFTVANKYNCLMVIIHSCRQIVHKAIACPNHYLAQTII